MVYDNDGTPETDEIGNIGWLNTNRANSKAFECGTVKNRPSKLGSAKVLHEVRPIRQYHEDIKI